MKAKKQNNNTRNKQMKKKRRVFIELLTQMVRFSEINDVSRPSNIRVMHDRSPNGTF